MDTTMIWSLVRLGLVLLVVIPGAIYATRWYASRQTPGKDLRIKEALSLGPNKAVYVVEWRERTLLLGVTNQSITVLDHQASVSEVEDKEVIK